MLLLCAMIPAPSYGQGIPRCESLVAVIQHFAQGSAEDAMRLRMQLAEAKAQLDQQRTRAEAAEAKVKALSPKTAPPEQDTK